MNYKVQWAVHFGMVLLQKNNVIISLENEDCNNALKRIFPKINLNIINEIIDKTDYISEIRKEFYKKKLKLRYESILKYSYDLLTKN